MDDERILIQGLNDDILQDEVSLHEVKPDGVKPDEVKPDGVKPDEVKPDVVKPDEVKPDEVKPDEVKPDGVKPDEFKPDEVKPDEDSGKEGGRSGWIAVFSLWMQAFIWTGSFKGLGLMLPILQQQFNTNAAIIGWMVGMIGAMIGFVGKFPPPNSVTSPRIHSKNFRVKIERIPEIGGHMVIRVWTG